MTDVAPSGRRVLCIGAAHWDVIGHAAGPAARGDDLPGRVVRAPGGVALNLALWLRHEGVAAELLTALGDDAAGQELLAQASALGVICDRVLRIPGQATGSYVAIEDPSGLVAAVADTAAMDAAGVALLEPVRRDLDVRRVVIDGNLDAVVLGAAATLPALADAEICVAGASPAKAARLRALLGHPRLVLHLNRAEAANLCGAELADSHSAAGALCALGAAAALVTDGARPAAWADATGLMEEATPPALRAPRVTGAGDRLMAAHIAARLQGLEPRAALTYALDRTADHIRHGEPACIP